ncbi:family 78 glycoside hydrolase catalytic domain [Congregicoccus parvus]|uniref:family 78 glycoside hydrolase catalytic domain n=1 Tax=Congregicoccus parvus TaxID=3081749 RepID=UPI003FA5281E
MTLAPTAVVPALASGSAGASLAITRLTTNGRSEPLGIAAHGISLAWIATSTQRGVMQQAYEIRVGTSAGSADVWDSGRVESARQIDVVLPSSIALAPATRYRWQVRIWDQDGHASAWSEPASFETGLLSSGDWSGAAWLGGAVADASSSGRPSSLPLLRGEFTARADVVSARLYASAQGLYEASINGRKVGDQFLAPGWTDYETRIQHQTYDITDLLRAGTNAIGVALADGWFRGKVGLNWKRIYGTDLAFIAKIKITYADGSIDWFGTDSTWRAGDGPWVRADLQDGEAYDAALEQPGWNRPGFDASAWRAVQVVTDVSTRLVPQPDEPVRALAVLPARTRTEILPQTWVYDLGQNMVGVVRVVLRGTRGQTVTLRHAEDIHRTGPRAGQIYTENLRTAKATDTYTFAADGVVTYQPIFTQHGFRYLEITGVSTPPELADVQGVVLGSDLPGGGDLHTGHPMLDQLVSNIRWGQRGNFLSIPTDTPARDERLGWTGDINVFAPAAARLQDTRAFLAKWMTDVRDAQKPDGNIPAIVPFPRREFGETGVGWSDAFITVPYAVWRATGDESILRENWEAMKRFHAFVHASATADGDLLEQGRASWFSGDWLTLEGVDRLEEHKVIATAYFAENTRMMAEMAAALGETVQAAGWFALVPRIRAAFLAAYRAGDGSIHTGTQTVYALTLGTEMIADPAQRARTAERFLEKLAADDHHLRTGFLGTPWLLPALTRIGRDDLAVRVLLNEDYPSWGFPIKMGATTMWERWNSIRPDGEFGPVDMNSFNHYAYGAVGDWMFSHLGGLQALEPGYKRSRIAPLVGHGGLAHVRCTQETAYGRLASAWSVDSARATLEIEIPVNTTAIVCLPGSDGAGVVEGGRPAGSAPGVHFLRVEDGAALYAVGSGCYEFSWDLVPTGR